MSEDDDIRSHLRGAKLGASVLARRMTAMVTQAFELANGETTHLKGRKDFVGVLARQIVEDPFTALERLRKYLPSSIVDPQEPKEQAAPLALNIKALYLQATKEVNEQARLIEAQPAGNSRVTIDASHSVDW